MVSINMRDMRILIALEISITESIAVSQVYCGEAAAIEDV